MGKGGDRERETKREFKVNELVDKKKEMEGSIDPVAAVVQRRDTSDNIPIRHLSSMYLPFLSEVISVVFLQSP